MTAIADLLLDSIKQYAQFLKRQFSLSLAEAQELTAKAHGFAGWHELTAVASRSPLDERLRGAAFSRRGSPAVSTPAAVDVALQAEERLAKLAGQPSDNCISANRKARGFAAGEAPSPVSHLDFRSVPIVPGAVSAEEMNGCFQLNLFDPEPRFVAIGAVSGWGKSVLGASIAMTHAQHGGNVCWLTPFGEPSLSHPDDEAGRLLGQLLTSSGGSTQLVGSGRSLGSFTKATRLICDDASMSRPPLDAVLRDLRPQLLPFSILFIDEPAFFSTPAERLGRVADEIDQVLSSGTAVVWMSQDVLHYAPLPLNERSQESSVLLLGRSGYGFSDRQPDQYVTLAHMARDLPREHGKRVCWICAVSWPGRHEAHFLDVRLEDICARAAAWQQG